MESPIGPGLSSRSGLRLSVKEHSSKVDSALMPGRATETSFVWILIAANVLFFVVPFTISQNIGYLPTYALCVLPWHLAGGLLTLFAAFGARRIQHRTLWLTLVFGNLVYWLLPWFDHRTKDLEGYIFQMVLYFIPLQVAWILAFAVLSLPFLFIRWPISKARFVLTGALAGGFFWTIYTAWSIGYRCCPN